MPIITPAYPAMNSTYPFIATHTHRNSFKEHIYNVSESTLKLLKEEFARGAELTNKLENNACTWSVIFDKCDFFSRYKVYLQIDILATSEQEHHKWYGFSHCPRQY